MSSKESGKDLSRFLKEEHSYPIKRFKGRNRICMCGKNSRCFMGSDPKALIKTGLFINIPSTLFNVFVAPSDLWEDKRWIFLGIGLFLQLLTNVLMIATAFQDPGIVPATSISLEAGSRLKPKYTCIF